MVSGAKHAVQRHGDIALQHITLANFLVSNTRPIRQRPYPPSKSQWSDSQKLAIKTSNDAVLYPDNRLQLQSREARESSFIHIVNGGQRHATFAPISDVLATHFSDVVKAISNEHQRRPKRDRLRSSNPLDVRGSLRPQQEHIGTEVSNKLVSKSNVILKIPTQQSQVKSRSLLNRDESKSFHLKDELKRHHQNLFEEMLSLCLRNVKNHSTRLEILYLQGICSQTTPCNTRTRTGILRRFVHLNLKRDNLDNIIELSRIISQTRNDHLLRHMTTADMVAYIGTLLISVARNPQVNAKYVQFLLKTYDKECKKDRDFEKHTNPAFMMFIAAHLPLQQSLPEIEKRLYFMSQDTDFPPTKFIHELYSLLQLRLHRQCTENQTPQKSTMENMKKRINQITYPSLHILPKNSRLIQNMLRYATSLEEVKHVRSLVQNSHSKAKILSRTNYHFLIAAFRTFPNTKVLGPFEQIRRSEELVAMFLWLQKECPSGLSSATMGVAAIIFSRIGAHTALKRLTSSGNDFFSQNEDRKHQFIRHICHHLPLNGKKLMMNPTESAAFIEDNIIRKLLLYTISDSRMRRSHQMTLLDAIRALGHCGDAVTITKAWKALRNLYKQETLLRDAPPTIISSLVASGDVTTAHLLFRNVIAKHSSLETMNPYITSRLISAILPLPSFIINKRQNGIIPINEIIACAAKQTVPWKFVIEDYIMRNFGANAGGLGHIIQVWGDEIQKCITEIHSEEKLGSVDESLLMRLEETFSK